MPARTIVALLLIFMSGCAVSPPTKKQLDSVKANTVVVYQYRKKDGKAWFFADKITRVEGDRIFYLTTTKEANVKESQVLDDFLKEKEYSMKKSELLTYLKEQGEDKKVIVEVR